MSSDHAIRARGLGKAYHLYARPVDRLKQALWRHTRRFYEEFWALREVSFEVERGETVGIVGRNGSGKTTLLRIIGGLVAPTAGTAEIAGRMATLLSLGTGFHAELTGRENVELNASLAGFSRREIGDKLEAIADFAEIGEFLDQPVKTYSTGMFVRLAFALSISVEPDILLVDEALAVGDEAFQRKCYARLGEMRRRGVTLLVVSHSSSLIVELCDRALLLDGGERLLFGSPKSVISRYHRLIFAPPADVHGIREEIRGLDRTGAAAAPAVPPRGRPSPEPLEPEGYDAALVPRSTVSYVPRGATVRGARIVNAAGAPSNVLRRGGRYYCEYEVEFSEEAAGVRVGTMIKSTSGVELGAVASHAQGHGIPHVAAGTRLRVRVPFRAALVPGTYFLNAGLLGVVDGGERFLHRVLDAVMFRVALEKDLPLAQMVDFSADEPVSIEEIPEMASAGRAAGAGDEGHG